MIKLTHCFLLKNTGWYNNSYYYAIHMQVILVLINWKCCTWFMITYGEKTLLHSWWLIFFLFFCIRNYHFPVAGKLMFWFFILFCSSTSIDGRNCVRKKYRKKELRCWFFYFFSTNFNVNILPIVPSEHNIEENNYTVLL